MSKKAQKFIKAAASAAVKLIKENDSDKNSSGDDANSDSSSESTNDNLTTDPSFVCGVNLGDNTTDRTTRATLSGQTWPEIELGSSEEERDITQSLTLVTQSSVTAQTPVTYLTNTEVTLQVPNTSTATSTVTHNTKNPPAIMNEADRASIRMMCDSFKEIGLAAKQNSTSFLSELPYFGVSQDFDPKKNIIPLNEPTRFLEIVNLVTDTADFTVAGKIKVLKSKLLGSALEHWSNYDGGDSWDNAKKHLLSMFPEVQSYTSAITKVAQLKRENKEQISQYATRIVKTFNNLQKLHPGGNYHDKVKQSDSIRKLLEVLPLQDRKWIKNSNPAENTFPEVLKQILVYVETESALRLSQEDINREQKNKSTTYEVNSTEQSGSSKKSKKQSQQIAANEQGSSNSGNQGSKQNNPNFGKTCNYCHKQNHIISECKKKKFNDQNRNQNRNQGAQQGNSNYKNGSNFKYNPNQGNYNSNSNITSRYNYCNCIGHNIGTCRFRQKNEYLNAASNGSNSITFCKYCKCAGHSISNCRKRQWKENQEGNNAGAADNSNAGPINYNNNPSPRKCYRCNETTHIAKFCPVTEQKNFQ